MISFITGKLGIGIIGAIIAFGLVAYIYTYAYSQGVNSVKVDVLNKTISELNRQISERDKITEADRLRSEDDAKKIEELNAINGQLQETAINRSSQCLNTNDILRLQDLFQRH